VMSRRLSAAWKLNRLSRDKFTGKHQSIHCAADPGGAGESPALGASSTSWGLLGRHSCWRAPSSGLHEHMPEQHRLGHSLPAHVDTQRWQHPQQCLCICEKYAEPLRAMAWMDEMRSWIYFNQSINQSINQSAGVATLEASARRTAKSTTSSIRITFSSDTGHCRR
jgi:hypothetical protein